MQHELLSFLVPFFMANHPNSAGVLHFAWQGAAVSGVRKFVRGEDEPVVPPPSPTHLWCVS